MIAFFMPAARVLLCFVKKLTVIGIIGKIHGVSNAVKPKRNATIKMVHRLLCSCFLFCSKAVRDESFAIFSDGWTSVEAGSSERVSVPVSTGVPDPLSGSEADVPVI